MVAQITLREYSMLKVKILTPPTDIPRRNENNQTKAIIPNIASRNSIIAFFIIDHILLILIPYSKGNVNTEKAMLLL